MQQPCYTSSMKLLQLNIECGKRLEEIAELIISSDYDIICMQEMSGGGRFQMVHRESREVDLDKYPSKDTFVELQRRLPGWKGELVKSFSGKTGEDYLGNAIFYKPSLSLKSRNVVWMGEPTTLEVTDLDTNKFPYTALALEFTTPDQQTLHVMTGHFLVWGRPYDSDVTIKNAKKVYDYVATLKDPFILTGDFNVDARSITCVQFENISRNLVRMLDIRNTLNPRLHRVKALFPEGIACDQIFVSPQIATAGFRLRQEDISDHFGLELEFEIRPNSANPIGGLPESQA